MNAVHFTCPNLTILSSIWCPPQGIKLTPKHFAYLKSPRLQPSLHLLHHPVDAR